MTVIAEKITDSIGAHSPRCLTIRATNPKFIHQETLRHRLIYIKDALRGDPDFSFSVSSARAIPFKKLLEEVRSDELRAIPVKWGTEKKGMSPGEELDNIEANLLWESGVFSQPTPSRFRRFVTARDYAQLQWRQAALDAANHAEELTKIGVHKSIVNRIIEPYIHVHCLMTATEPGWMNFFGLRLDKAADPTLRALAEECWKVWNESVPQKLEPGQWHLPFVNDEDNYGIEQLEMKLELAGEESLAYIEYCRRISAARCARLSYQSFETGKRSTIEEDLNLYNRLVGGPVLHASPCEHQCTPDAVDDYHSIQAELQHRPELLVKTSWLHPELHGNLKGWIQFRKTLPGEALAPLPERYGAKV